VLDYPFDIDTTEAESAISLINPMSETDCTLQTSFLSYGDIGNSRIKIDTLKKNDVFFTYEGEATNISHLWVFKDKNTYPNTVKLKGNNGFSLNDISKTSLKYRGFTKGAASDSKKGILQGSTRWIAGAGYYTLSNIQKGEFSIMIIDTKNKSFSEYQFYYLGSTNQNKVTQEEYDEKYKDCLDEFVLIKKTYDDGFIFVIEDAKKGYAQFINTTVFYPEEGGSVADIFDKDCGADVYKALVQGEFHLFVLSNDGKTHIILNKKP